MVCGFQAKSGMNQFSMKIRVIVSHFFCHGLRIKKSESPPFVRHPRTVHIDQILHDLITFKKEKEHG